MDLDPLFSLISYPLTASDKAILESAYQYAKEKHGDQKRNSGEPYFTHSVAVAKNCADIGMDIETIVAALLHDVLEDTDATEAEMKEKFGDQVLFLVKGVTKLGKLKYQGRERHVESLRKFFIAMAEDIRVLIIKLADRLHNVQTLEHVRKEKQKRIALETIEVHAALAGRMGMEKLKGLLEDYSFPYAYPIEYAKTIEAMKAMVPQANTAVNYAHKEIEKVIHDFKISDTTVHSRIKHTYSTYRKLEKYKWNTDLIYDVVALRVITETIADCYQVLGLVHMLWKPIPKRIKDFIALPKPNGYRSLHTTVITERGIIEIQIRTKEMHLEAEIGVASHLIYKETETGHKKKKVNGTSFAWLDELKNLQNIAGSPSKFLQQLHMDLFRDRIFVFTPQGDVIDLPEEATPIDFAYAIHSDIGHTTHAARINGKIASLGEILHNGDIVEIVTNKNAKPTSKWLDYAKTTIARRKIRSYLAEHGGMLQRFLSKE